MFLRNQIVAAALSATLAVLPGGQAKAPRDVQEAARELAPEALLRLVEETFPGGRAFHKVTRGDVVGVLTERGSLEAVKSTEILCEVKGKGKGAFTTTIKWVIDDGSTVRKGDRLVELDDSALREELRVQKSSLAEARAERAQAAEHLENVRREGAAEVGLAEVDLKIAELERKRYAGGDADQKQLLGLKVERASLMLDRARARARSGEAKAKAAVQANTAVVDAQNACQQEIEEQIARCRIVAPRDGLVVYYVPEQVWGGGGSQQSIVAQGEPVREGQKLLSIPDLTKMAVKTRIHEAMISHVRVGQPAEVRVDAFPGKAIAGRVAQVSPVGSPRDWLARDVKVYPVLVELTGPPNRSLKPGMSAEVRISVGRRAGVLKVPAQAVLKSGKGTTCYVQVGKELLERKVVVGLNDGRDVEVTEGLREGDVVLDNPRAQLGPRQGADAAAPVMTTSPTRPATAAPPVVTVSQPVKREVTDSVDFTGRTDAVQSVDLRARVTGYLVKMPFKEGSTVKKGDVLFEIDPRPYMARLDAAEAQVALARAQLRLAQTTLARDKALAKSVAGSVSPRQLDQDQGAVEEAEARVRAQQASLEVDKLRLQFSRVTSPIDGQIGRSHVTEGNLVREDETPLATVVSLDPIYAYFDMDEATLLGIKRAANAGKIESPEQGRQPVFLRLPGEDGYPHRGTIDFVDNRVNPTTGAIAVRGVFPNPRPPGGTRLLAPGMFVRVRLPIGRPHAALLVSDRAVGSDQGLRYVYVVGADNKVEQRRVTTGALQEDGLRVISEGLKPGEWVVVGGLRQLRPRLAVRREKTAMPTLSRPVPPGK